jgi:phosphoribosyl 1,2-cyclic phosphate phosphodiesterase
MSGKATDFLCLTGNRLPESVKGENGMKVTLLGTSAAEGCPGLFCHCESCVRARNLGGKNIRTRSSALIDTALKIDFPPDILHQMVQYNISLCCMKALLFTHGHDDHFSPAELQYRGKYFVSSPETEPLPIYGPRDVIERVEETLNPELVAFSLHTLEEEKTESIAGYEVTPFLANHDPSRPCFNYIIRDREGVTLLYASDTGWYGDSAWKILEKYQLDGIVVECAKREEGGYPGHLSIPEVIRMQERLHYAGCLRPDSVTVTTHFSHLMNLTHHELETILLPHGIQTGYDGLSFEIGKA